MSCILLRLTETIGKRGMSWLYAGFGAAAVAFFWFWLPETRGRTLEQIEQESTVSYNYIVIR